MAGKLKSIRLDNYKPLREIVFEALREAIITGELKPGERLMEVQLAEEMGVSRTPVREAIRKLELEGLVVMIPRRGAYVSGLSLKDAADVFEVRQSLEGLAAALAAERITDEELESLERILVEISEAAEKDDVDTVIKKDSEFHQILFKATRNDRLVQIINNLKEQIDRFRLQSFTNRARVRSLLEEHKKIVEAISDRNVELAKKLAEEHIERVENNVMNILRKQMDFEEELSC
ncbi:GntR family transcriptional regulator [Thermosediminibacter oceani]|uniref:Transcriptional regulator, GntR family n=1 Tax=Thermosediminibacter oceani (strain ATCC BAA-1034 / DSM 16646 / JW/IW-1228P) TaxID=555079 RepID=D9RZE3_THEOJ|nr:GntR family transcriptional regulator [Thermosediminibacter oceani]ADL06841.1 transcriptional regulator, GntR family [Thermosediminibacter oceani DSM 16646]